MPAPAPSAVPPEEILLPEAVGWAKGWLDHLPTDAPTDPSKLAEDQSRKTAMLEKIASWWTEHHSQESPPSNAEAASWEALPPGCEDIGFKMSEADYRHAQRERDQFILESQEGTTNVLSSWSERLRRERKFLSLHPWGRRSDSAASSLQSGGMISIAWLRPT